MKAQCATCQGMGVPFLNHSGDRLCPTCQGVTTPSGIEARVRDDMTALLESLTPTVVATLRAMLEEKLKEVYPLTTAIAEDVRDAHSARMRVLEAALAALRSERDAALADLEATRAERDKLDLRAQAASASRAELLLSFEEARAQIAALNAEVLRLKNEKVGYIERLEDRLRRIERIAQGVDDR